MRCRWRAPFWRRSAGDRGWTLRTDAALEAIRAIAREVPQAIVGAGTVLGRADLDAARDAGARFAVSPGATPELLAAGRECGLPPAAGRDDAVRSDRGRCGRLRHAEAVPRRAGRWRRHAQGPGRSVPSREVLSTGGISLASAPEYPGVAERLLRGRLLDRSARVDPAAEWASITRLARQARRLRA